MSCASLSIAVSSSERMLCLDLLPPTSFRAWINSGIIVTARLSGESAFAGYARASSFPVSYSPFVSLSGDRPRS